MNIAYIFVAALLLTTSESPGEAVRADPPVAEFQEPYAAPPGTKEEQELWLRSVDVARLIHAGQATAGKLQRRYKVPKIDVTLGAAARQQGSIAEEAKAARAGVEAAWRRNAEFLKSQWPVDPVRVCQYPAMDFESQLNHGDKAGREQRVAPVKKALEACISKAESVLRVLTTLNKELEGAISEAERVVAAARPPAAKAADKRQAAEHEAHEERERQEKKEQQGKQEHHEHTEGAK